ncbi:MAG: hypothetical protein SFY67_08780 [Candidatus Melainabacteria bacterium]|nr:hypothetical protein [Candidatus Melainabacteria bacterium]
MMRRKKALFSLCLALAASSSFAASATPEQGIEEFKKKNYAGALTQFTAHLKEHPDDLNINYYAGMCYQLSGKTGDAIKYYRRVSEIDPKSKAAAQVRPFLAKYGIKTGAPTNAQTPNGTPLPSDPFAAMEAARRLPFKERIVVVPPKFGHKPVSASTVATAKGILSRLPQRVYNILDKGGATINLAPNIIDKWPGSGDGMKPGSSHTTMGEEGGRTYDHDVHVYEREAIRNSNELKDMRDQSEIYNALLHEIGHAVDDCSSSISKTKSYIDAHNIDVSNMPAKAVSNYYTSDPSEGFAEIMAFLLGGNDNDAKSAGEYFPRTKAIIRSKLGI